MVVAEYNFLLQSIEIRNIQDRELGKHTNMSIFARLSSNSKLAEQSSDDAGMEDDIKGDNTSSHVLFPAVSRSIE